MISAVQTNFRRVVIYTGHHKNPVLGPYSHNIAKRVRMFREMNETRKSDLRSRWKISLLQGEHLVEKLSRVNPRETLLVIPAGQSTNLDHVFSPPQLSFLMNGFFKQGGRAYLNCGSAYWASETRVYEDLCETSPTTRKTIIKKSRIPLFKGGVAIGPLCKFPGKEYKVGFFSDAIDIENNQGDECTIFLSGGGSFVLPQPPLQETRVLTRYKSSELSRLGKTTQQEQEQWKIASIMTRVGEGAVAMAMYHPYYGARDIDTERYNQAFPNCGTDWEAIHRRLSPLHVRIRFMLDSLIYPLENLDFKSDPLSLSGRCFFLLPGQSELAYENMPTTSPGLSENFFHI